MLILSVPPQTRFGQIKRKLNIATGNRPVKATPAKKGGVSKATGSKGKGAGKAKVKSKADKGAKPKVTPAPADAGKSGPVAEATEKLEKTSV